MIRISDTIPFFNLRKEDIHFFQLYYKLKNIPYSTYIKLSHTLSHSKHKHRRTNYEASKCTILYHDWPVMEAVGEMADGLARGGGEKAPERYPPRSASACFALSTLSLSLWNVLPQVRPRYGQFSCLTPAAVTPVAAAPAPEAPFNSSAPAYEQLALSYITKEPLKSQRHCFLIRSVYIRFVSVTAKSVTLRLLSFFLSNSSMLSYIRDRLRLCTG